MDSRVQQNAERKLSQLDPSKLLWAPQPGPQLAAIEADWCYELMYGGARGGGKSIYLLMDFLQDVHLYGSAWQGIIVRKSYPELEQIIADSWKIFPQTKAVFEKQPKTWLWPNGAALKFRNLESEEDAQQYQGHSYSWLGIDEAGNYATPNVFFRMLATVRSGDDKVKTARVRLTANPAGVGHHWLKQRYIDPAPHGFTPLKEGSDTRERMFIPSKVTDNKILLQNDPFYIENLKKQGSEELVRAWLYGDWDVQAGSFYPEFKLTKHVIESIIIPQHWTRYRTFDWGSYHPFCVLWWAVSDGTSVYTVSGQRKYFPRGALICYREWYGMEKNRPNVGIRMSNEDLRSGIISRTGKDENILMTATDSLPFQYRGGPMMAEIFFNHGAQNSSVSLKEGNTDRITGAAQVRSRLQGNREGPLLYFVNTCINCIRTLPALQSDPHKPEDVDTDCEDHAYDAVRLACMERPITRDKPDIKNSLKPLNETTFNELLEYDRLHSED